MIIGIFIFVISLLVINKSGAIKLFKEINTEIEILNEYDNTGVKNYKKHEELQRSRNNKMSFKTLVIVYFLLAVLIFLTYLKVKYGV